MSCGRIEIGIEPPLVWLFLDNSIIPKAQGPMPFILLTLLSFQGSTHLLGVGSFNKLLKQDNINIKIGERHNGFIRSTLKY